MTYLWLNRTLIAEQREFIVFKVYVICFDQALASAVTGVIDLFALAGVSWQRLNRTAPEPIFDVKMISTEGQAVNCINQIVLQPQLSFKDARNADLILIPTIGGDIDTVLIQQYQTIEWLAQQHEKGVDIAANCTGNFILAQANILNGRHATTHWGYESLFRQKFPEVLLQPEQMIVQDGNVFSAGGGMSWFDLGLLLIERFAGHDVAIETAKAWVIDVMRTDQRAYASIQGKKYHSDKTVLAVQSWLESHLCEPIKLSAVAKQFGISTRQLVRRFNSAIAIKPSEYLQLLRIESAKSLLENRQFSLVEIVHRVGYEDLSSFSRLFKKHTSLSPAQYRQKFARKRLIQ